MLHFDRVHLYLKLPRLSGCVLLLLALLACSIHAQDQTQRVFEAVPLESRPRLIERLKEYVGYERTRQYEKLYELLYDRDDDTAGKEAYLKARLGSEIREGVVQEFIPTFVLSITVEDNDPPTFSLVGKAKVIQKGRMVQKEMTIKARLQDGEWYFSELISSFFHVA